MMLRTGLDQEVASAAVLVEPALRVVKLAQQQGFRVIGERKADLIVMPSKLESNEAADDVPKIKASFSGKVAPCERWDMPR